MATVKKKIDPKDALFKKIEKLMEGKSFALCYMDSKNNSIILRNATCFETSIMAAHLSSKAYKEFQQEE